MMGYFKALVFCMFMVFLGTNNSMQRELVGISPWEEVQQDTHRMF